MPLKVGAQLGHYEILGPLGAGGMGEVYRARDAKLGRDVALKVLPAAFASDAQRMARFQRESQVLASLNHPNIASIYGLEESSTGIALVMELVEGETLAERIVGTGLAPPRAPQGVPLQIDEALAIAKQIAEALEAAHEKGVIHRDLKPANIKITPQGTVKILDFGLAKAIDPQDSISSPSHSPNFSPTLSIAATQAGVILGTVAYMSPEQAKGKSVDRRADIWAFGCVLYEMLTGQKPFEGESVSDTLAAVIKDAPSLDRLTGTTPRAIRSLLSRCLVKDPKRRLQAIGEARIAIEEYLANPGAEEAPSPPTDFTEKKEPGPRRRKSLLAMLLVAGLILALGLVAGWLLRAQRNIESPTWSGQLLGGPATAMGGRISPDGHTLAFQAMVDGMTQVAVMDTESGDWTVLTKNRSRGYVTELNWSLDGTEIYFDRNFSGPLGIFTVSRFGGDERLILENAGGPQVLPDGSLLVTLVNKNRDIQLNHFWPDSSRLLPLDSILAGPDLCPPVRAFRDGKEAVFYGKTLDQAKTDPVEHLYAIDLTSGKTRRLAPELDLAASVINLFPLAVPLQDQSVLIDSQQGDLHSIVEVPRRGSGPARTLFSLTSPPMFMDVGKDGALYIDQAARPNEILKFSTSGGTPEVLGNSETQKSGAQITFQLADGSVLLDSVVAGKSRLLLGKPGGDVVPLIATKEETAEPECLVGEREVAFLLGSSDNAVIAVASIGDGRILRRLKGVPGTGVTNLSPSRDGQTLFYTAARNVWAIPATDGQPRLIGPGDEVAADPNGRDLIVGLNEKEGVRLVRVPVLGGTEEAIPLRSDLRLAPTKLDQNAIGKDGRVLVSIATPDSWFYRPGTLDLRSGKLDRIPLNFTGDVMGLGWQSDGSIISTGWPLRAKLWRFRPTAPAKKQ
jgi:serine/threonine protein kinase